MANCEPMESRTSAEKRRERDYLLNIVESDVRDWFTLAPSYRTKERLIQMIRASLGGND